MSEGRTIEDNRFLRGRGTFVANLDDRGALHVVFVRATVAHARIAAIDVAPAERAPGVHAVFTAGRLGIPRQSPELPGLHPAMTRSLLADDAVRFVGEPIAAVVADSPARAADAAEAVLVDYDPLAAVIGAGVASTDATLVHDAAGTNVALRMSSGEPFDHGPVRVEAEIRHSTVSPAPLEGRAILADFDGDGLTAWVSGQGPHPFRDRVAAALELSKEQVRVVCTDAGGSFGGKAIPHAEEVIVAGIARQLGRPVRWIDGRTESMQSLGHSRGQQQHIALSGTPDGRFTGVELRITQDAGAYPRLGAYMPNMARLMLPGPYRIPHIDFDAASVVTTTNPHVAYRGAGQPEYASALEHAVDRFARAVALDPVEVRRRNLIDAFPYHSPTGAVYDSGDYGRALAALVAAAGYDELRADQARRRAAGGAVARGIGVATFVESCSTSNQPEWGRIVVRPDGSVDAWSGTSPHGQGHETTFAALIQRVLGDAPIRLHFGDSDYFASGTVTGGSRSVQTGGVALAEAAERVVDRAREIAADRLEANVADVVYDRDARAFHVRGSPARQIALAETARHEPAGCVESIVHHQPEANTISFGAYLAAVDVDVETGRVELARFVAADDCGTVVNHTLVEGQVHGGVVQGIGQALFEEIVYDEQGNLLTANFAEYLLPAAAEVPPIETVVVETPSPRNRLGVKGVGESGPIGALPAVLNAIVDALAPYGVEQIDMPATPERVWRAIWG